MVLWRRSQLAGSGMFARTFCLSLIVLALAGGWEASSYAQGVSRSANTPRYVQPFPRRPVRLYVTPLRDVKRACTVRYVQEWRPSGPVIVPRMRCWWVRN